MIWSFPALHHRLFQHHQICLDGRVCLNLFAEARVEMQRDA